MSENQQPKQCLEYSFECVVVNILVYIESCKDVKCMAEVNLSWNRYVASKDWEKVGTTDYRVHMYN